MNKKLAILSISTVTGSATAITTIIPLISVSFINKNISQIESLITISSISAVITILLNGLISKSIGIKRTTIIGLIIGMVFGIWYFSYFFN